MKIFHRNGAWSFTLPCLILASGFRHLLGFPGAFPFVLPYFPAERSPPDPRTTLLDPFLFDCISFVNSWKHQLQLVTCFNNNSGLVEQSAASFQLNHGLPSTLLIRFKAKSLHGLNHSLVGVLDLDRACVDDIDPAAFVTWGILHITSLTGQKNSGVKIRRESVMMREWKFSKSTGHHVTWHEMWKLTLRPRWGDETCNPTARIKHHAMLRNWAVSGHHNL